MPPPLPARDVRYYRERIAAVGEYVEHLHAPIHEGYQHPPKMIGEGLARLVALCDELDREWAKADARNPAVGGALKLAEVER